MNNDEEEVDVETLGNLRRSLNAQRRSKKKLAVGGSTASGGASSQSSTPSGRAGSSRATPARPASLLVDDAEAEAEAAAEAATAALLAARRSRGSHRATPQALEQQEEDSRLARRAAWASSAGGYGREQLAELRARSVSGGCGLRKTEERLDCRVTHTHTHSLSAL